MRTAAGADDSIGAAPQPLLKGLIGAQAKLRQLRQLARANAASTALRGKARGRKKSGAPAADRGHSAANEFHELRRLLDERAFYPPHAARKESPEYAKVHKQLVAAAPCLICGVTNSTLKDASKRVDPKLNPFGAKQLETHHHVIEWALANAIDPEKFNERVFPHLKIRHPGDYSTPLSAQAVHDWVDHSPDNLWVLCDVHHRAKWFGIHMITDPIWGPQDILSQDFLAKASAALKQDNGTVRKKQPGKAVKKTNAATGAGGRSAKKAAKRGRRRRS